MKPLFVTTIARLIRETELRILEIKQLIADKDMTVLGKLKTCDTVAEARKIISENSSQTYQTLLEQYEDDMAYLAECSQKGEIMLDKTEWKHYFKVAVRPELC